MVTESGFIWPDWSLIAQSARSTGKLADQFPKPDEFQKMPRNGTISAK